MISITFKKGEQEWIVDAKEGQTIKDVAQGNDVDLECACEGSLACSTCHVIFENNEVYKKSIPSQGISDEENDMLDLAYGLTATSRLGCQVKVIEDMSNAVLIIPTENRNSGPSS